jgi:hypothetical protein
MQRLGIVGIVQALARHFGAMQQVECDPPDRDGGRLIDCGRAFLVLVSARRALRCR